MAIIPVDLTVDPQDDRALQAWVEVRIDGAGVRMLLDTGSRLSAVPASLVTAPPTEQVSVGRGVSGDADRSSTSRIDVLAIGDALELRDLPVDIQPGGWPHPAHVGRQVFGDLPCDLRLADGLIETDATRPTAAITVGTCWGGSRAGLVTLRWPETELTAVFDTGAGITIVDQGWAMDHPDAITVTDAEAQGTDVTGNAVAGRRGRSHPYTIGDVAFPDQGCGVVDLSGLNQHLAEPITMILGLPQLVSANWFLDPADGTLSIHRRHRS